MKTDIPAILRAHELIVPERFPFRYSRMRMRLGYHRISEARLHQHTVNNDGPAPVLTSTGALVDRLKVVGAKKVSIPTPYMRPLTQLVINYIEHEGIEVMNSITLEIADNLELCRQEPRAHRDHQEVQPRQR